MLAASAPTVHVPASITTVTLADLEEWIGALIQPRTKHAYKSDVMAFFKSHRRGLVTVNPTLLLDPIRVPKSIPKPAPPEVIARALTAADGDTQVMILLGALAGL